ncbi:MAG: peptidylprolyl isomerase [Candidatus Bipolaricaulia bacterium]
MRRLIEKYGKFVIWAIAISFLLGALVIFTPGKFNIARQGSPQSRVPALIVNGEKITQGQFDEQYNNLLEYYRQLYTQSGLGSFDLQLKGPSGAVYQLRLKAGVLQDLIRRALLDQEAKRRGITVSKAEYEAALTKEVERQLSAILSYYQMSEDELRDRLAEQGRTIDDFKKDIRKQLEQHKDELVKQLQDEKLRATVVTALSPSDEELRNYFEENKPEFAKPEMVRARHILVKVAQDAPEAEVAKARARIEEIKKELAAGANFAELARKYSEDEGTAQKGGDLGWFQRGQMVKEFEEAAFALKVGEVSEIVRSQYGFHIIKLEDRKPATTFEEVKDQVRSAYISEKGQEQFDNWYQQIRAAAEVKIELPLLAAYMLEETDKEAALAAYEKLAAEGKEKDLYLPYYIARLYEEKLREAEDRERELEGAPQPDEAALKAAAAEVANYRQKVLENLYKTLDAARGEEELFKELLTYDEENPELHYSYGQFLRDNGRADEALKQLDRALELKPDHLGALIFYGDIKLEKKSYDEAVAKYEQALALIRDQEQLKQVRTKLAQAYMAKQDYSRAEGLLAKVLEVSPEDQQALTLMGDLLSSTGRHAESAAYYKKALQVAGLKPELQVKLGSAYLKAGKLKEASEAFEAVIKGQSYYVADAYLGLGDVHRAEGLTEKALADYKEGFKRSQYRTQLREELGERILALDPEDTATRFDLAKTYQRDRAYDQAIAHYQELLKRQPDSFDAQQGLADSYFAKEDFANAKGAYKGALALTTDDTKRLLIYQKVLDSEEKLVGTGNKLGEDGLEALLEMAKLYLAQGKRDKAKEQLDRLEKEDPTWRAEEVAKLKAEVATPTPES